MLLIIMMMMMMKSRSMASCAGHLKSINLESNQDGNIDCPLLSPRPYNPYILIYHVKRLSCWWGWLGCNVKDGGGDGDDWWCQRWCWSEDDSVLFAKLSQIVSISVLSFCQDLCQRFLHCQILFLPFAICASRDLDFPILHLLLPWKAVKYRRCQIHSLRAKFWRKISNSNSIVWTYIYVCIYRKLRK